MPAKSSPAHDRTPPHHLGCGPSAFLPAPPPKETLDTVPNCTAIAAAKGAYIQLKKAPPLALVSPAGLFSAECLARVNLPEWLPLPPPGVSSKHPIFYSGGPPSCGWTAVLEEENADMFTCIYTQTYTQGLCFAPPQRCVLFRNSFSC